MQTTRFGGPEALEIVDTEPTPGPGQQLYDVSTAGIEAAEPIWLTTREQVCTPFCVHGSPRAEVDLEP